MERTGNRRLIYNDDGGYPFDRETLTPERFVRERLSWCLESQVDTYVYCVGDGFEPPYNGGFAYPAAVGDEKQLILETGRAAGLEMCASLRMNDAHCGIPDPACRALMPPLKVERPDLLLGQDLDYGHDAVLTFTWAAFNYALEEVRQLRLAQIERIGRAHDWDGIELDFCRFRRYFPLGTEDENAPLLTDFLRQARALTGSIGRERGRPYPLWVRVPEDLARSRSRLGLDVETWVAEGLVDVLVSGDGLEPFAHSHRPLIDLGRRFGIPVYPCLSASQLEPRNNTDDLSLPQAELVARTCERFRAAAANRWLEAPGGLYLFNLYVLWDLEHLGGFDERMRQARDCCQLLHELGDPRTLVGTDKRYRSEAFPAWVYWQYTVPPAQLPVRLIDWVEIPLCVGDAVESMARQGRLTEATLRVRLTGLLPEEGVHVELNGERCDGVARHEVTDDRVASVRYPVGGTWLEMPVSAPPLRHGDNRVVVHPGPGCWGKASTQVAEVQLVLRYAGDEP